MEKDNNCSKKGYANQREATSALSLIKKTSHRSKIPKRAYFCKDCNLWHLSSMGDFNRKDEQK